MYPLIDVVVPVYNADKFLERCLTSIIEQTYENIRILVINDGSTDGSMDIVRQFQQRYQNIDIIEQKNRGVGYARNVALKNLKGKYVSFVDADDFIEKNYIMKLWKKITKTEADIVVGNFNSYSNGMLIQKMEKEVIDIEDRLAFYEKYVIDNQLGYGVTNKMFRVTTLNESHIRFDETCRFGEDLLFVFKLYTYINRVAIEKDSCYHYICNSGSLTSVPKPDRCFEQFNLFLSFYDYLKEKELEKQYYQITGKLLWMFIISAINLSLREGATKQQIIDFCKYAVKTDSYREIEKRGLLTVGLMGWVKIECPNILKKIRTLCIAIPIKNNSWKVLKLFLLRR